MTVLALAAEARGQIGLSRENDVKPDLVPVLSFAAEGAKSFEVTGRWQIKPDCGISFRFSKDGDRMFGAVYDVRDGTPLILSDGKQSLLYDACLKRLVLIDRGRPWMLWYTVRNAEAPFAVDLSVMAWYVRNPMATTTAAAKILPPLARFDLSRIDRLAAFKLDRWLDASKRAEVYSGKSKRGSTYELRTYPDDAGRFDFVTRSADGNIASLYATRVNQPLEVAAFKFPETGALRGFVTVNQIDADTQASTIFGPSLKLGYAIGNPPKDATQTNRELFEANDKAFGEQYRAALAKLNVPPAPTLPQPATRPSTSR